MYGDATACAANMTCRPSTQACGGVCSPGQTQCQTNGGNPAVFRCDAEGQFTVFDHSCPSGLSCSSTDSTKCEDCDPLHYSDGCNETECDMNGNIVPGPGCTGVVTCCCESPAGRRCEKASPCPDACI